MRATMFLSTLFAVSLLAGAALADKPVDKLRHRGDTVDKVYRNARVTRVEQQSQAASPAARVRNPVDRAASRINCSDTGADCGSARASAQTRSVVTTSDAQRGVRTPTSLDKQLGNDRARYDESGLAQGMSTRAVKRGWSSHATTRADRAGGSMDTLALSRQKLHAREREQASEDRMVCNEADECMMSSKATKKIWGYESIKRGTWKGPGAARPLPGDVAVKAMRGEGGAKTVHQQDNARKAEQAAEAAEQSHVGQDHAH